MKTVRDCRCCRVQFLYNAPCPDILIYTIKIHTMQQLYALSRTKSTNPHWYDNTENHNNNILSNIIDSITRSAPHDVRLIIITIYTAQ